MSVHMMRGWAACRKKILEKRYVYHIVSKDTLQQIVRCGGVIFPRSNGYSNPWANAELVEKRSRFTVAGRFKLDDAVPFYLSPRQPMFCKLVREGKLRSDEIIALGFDCRTLVESLRVDYALYTTNPVYPGAVLLDGWVNRFHLNWKRLSDWQWNSDVEEKTVRRAKSAERQAELDIAGAVPLSLISHVVTDVHCSQFIMDLHFDRIAVEGLHVW